MVRCWLCASDFRAACGGVPVWSFGSFRAIWTTLRRAHGRSIFHARSLAHRNAQQNGAAYLAVQAGLTALMLIIARSGFFLSCGSIPPAQCETGPPKDCGIQHRSVGITTGIPHNADHGTQRSAARRPDSLARGGAAD